MPLAEGERVFGERRSSRCDRLVLRRVEGFDLELGSRLRDLEPPDAKYTNYTYQMDDKLDDERDDEPNDMMKGSSHMSTTKGQPALFGGFEDVFHH